MPVKYGVIARKNPQDPTAPPKYYPSIQSHGRVTTRQLAERMSQISTLSSIDMMAAMEAFLQVVPQELANGNIVDLGEFGTFWLRVNTTGEETEEAVTVRNITGLKPFFRPSKLFKNALSRIEFRKG